MLVQTKASTKASRPSLATTDRQHTPRNARPRPGESYMMQKLVTLNSGSSRSDLFRVFPKPFRLFPKPRNHSRYTAREHPCPASFCLSTFVLVLFPVVEILPSFPLLQQSLPTSCTWVRFLYKRRNGKPFRGTNIQASYKGLKRKKESMATKLIRKHIPN